MAMLPRFGLNGATIGSTDLLTDIQVAQEAGYEALEIRDAKLAAYLKGGGALYTLRRTLSDFGVEAVSLNALEQSTLATGEVRAEVLRRCRTMCEWAAGLACPYVVAVPTITERPASPPGRRSGARTIYDDSTVVTQTVAALRAMAEIARPFRVKIGFEFLGFANCSVNTLARARRVVEAADDPNIGLVIDAFHFHAGGSTWEMLDGLAAERLFVVHLSDAERRPRGELTDSHRLLPGDGVVPLRDLVKRLQRIGYSGVYSIELFRPEYWTRDPLEFAQAARHKMEVLFTGADA